MLKFGYNILVVLKWKRISTQCNQNSFKFIWKSYITYRISNSNNIHHSIVKCHKTVYIFFIIFIQIFKIRNHFNDSVHSSINLIRKNDSIKTMIIKIYEPFVKISEKIYKFIWALYFVNQMLYNINNHYKENVKILK